MTFCNSLSHRDSTFTPELARGPMHFCSAREDLYCLCPCFFAHALPSPSLSCFSVKHLASSGDDSGGPCTYTLSTMDQCGSIMVLPVLTYKSILNEERMGHCTRFHKCLESRYWYINLPWIWLQDCHRWHFSANPSFPKHIWTRITRPIWGDALTSRSLTQPSWRRGCGLLEQPSGESATHAREWPLVYLI